MRAVVGSRGPHGRGRAHRVHGHGPWAPRRALQHSTSGKPRKGVGRGAWHSTHQHALMVHVMSNVWVLPFDGIAYRGTRVIRPMILCGHSSCWGRLGSYSTILCSGREGLRPRVAGGRAQCARPGDRDGPRVPSARTQNEAPEAPQHPPRAHTASILLFKHKTHPLCTQTS